MAIVPCQLSAVIACYFMRAHAYRPRTILNLGVGTLSPELDIWKWLLPDAVPVGIDPRGKHRGWDAKYVQAAASDGSRATLDYCGKCKSVMCGKAVEHGRPTVVSAVTIDEVVEREGLSPPFFLWLDIEGGELDALRGAEATLQETKWMSLEMREFPWTIDYRGQLDAWLVGKGFRLHFENPGFEDRIYRRR